MYIYMLLFFFRRSIVLAFVSVLKILRVTNVWGYTEIFLQQLLILLQMYFGKLPFF